MARSASAGLAAGFGAAFGVEALEAGLGRVVHEAHRLGDGPVARLLGFVPLPWTLLVTIVGVILLIVFFAWLSWRFRSFRISDEAVEERSGILFRQHRRAPTVFARHPTPERQGLWRTRSKW